MKVEYYRDSTGKVYGYKPIDTDVEILSEEAFLLLKRQQEEEFQKIKAEDNLKNQLANIREEISILEDVEVRSKVEEQRLQELKQESTILYRKIHSS